MLFLEVVVVLFKIVFFFLHSCHDSDKFHFTWLVEKNSCHQFDAFK